MLHLILLLFIVVISFLFLKEKYGYTLCLVLSYSIIFSFLISQAGLSGMKLILLFSLYLVLFIKGVLDKTITLKKDALFICVLILFANLFLSNLMLSIYLSPSRIVSVNEYQVQFLIQIIVPYLLTIALLVNSSKSIIHQFIISIPYWGLLFILLVYFLVDLSKIDFNNRMSITENSGLSTIVLSRYCAIVFIGSVMLFMENIKQNSAIYVKVILLLTIVASFFYLFLVGQRGTILGVGLGLLLFFIFNINKSNVRQYILLFVLIAIGVYSIIEFNLFGLYDRFANLENYREFERYQDYFNSWDIFSQNSFLLPEGSMGYEYYTKRSYPHNMILECMVEYGLVGLLTVLLLFIFGGIYSIDLLKNRQIPITYKVIPVIWISQGVSVLVSSNIVGANLFFLFTALLTVMRLRTMNKNIIYVRRKNSIHSLRQYSQKWGRLF